MIKAKGLLLLLKQKTQAMINKEVNTYHRLNQKCILYKFLKDLVRLVKIATIQVNMNRWLNNTA